MRDIPRSPGVDPAAVERARRDFLAEHDEVATDAQTSPRALDVDLQAVERARRSFLAEYGSEFDQ